MKILVRRPTDCFRLALSDHPEHELIDPDRALHQHDAFTRALADAGLDVVWLPQEHDLPDAPFVSDTLLALPRAAGPDGETALTVLMRPGAPSRRPEVVSVARALPDLLGETPTRIIEDPGTLDGGDVIVFGDRLAVGISARTNEDGALQLTDAAGALGYRVSLCPVADRLHLASAITVLGPRRLVGTAAGFSSVDQGSNGAPPKQIERIVIPDAEAPAANVLAVGGTCFVLAGYPRTSAILRKAGERVVEVELDEFTRADGGPTCLVALLP